MCMLSILHRNIDIFKADTNWPRSFDSDLTFILSQDLAIRIPSHQLVLTQGVVTAPDSSARELLINSNEDSDGADFPLLGHPFLSSAYLFVDQYQGHFTIANANANANATEQVLVSGRSGTCFTPTRPRCPTDNPACVTGSPPEDPPYSLLSSMTRRHHTRDAEDTNASSGTYIGKAGISVAIYVPITSVSFAIIVVAYIRSYQKRPTQRAPNRKKQGPQYSLYPYFKPELSADAQPPHEMPLERNPAYVLAPYEVATKERRGEMRAEHESSIRSLQPPSRAHFAPKASRTRLTCRDVRCKEATMEDSSRRRFEERYGFDRNCHRVYAVAPCSAMRTIGFLASFQPIFSFGKELLGVYYS
ncbi:MAG: hypothetical protein Q9207_003183 [Kuettlingeria erythrocarpa]